MQKFLNNINLKGKKIFILGGCGLIGSEISKLLKRLGAKIIILDKSIKIQNKKIKFEYIDLENFSDIKKIIDKSIADYGAPDVFINCSYPGTNNWKYLSFHNLTIEELNKNLNLHLSSYIWTAKIFADQMKKKKTGSIILLSSIYGVVGQNKNFYKNLEIQENSAYPAIKGGIISTVRQLAANYGKFGIRVNAISPGAVLSKSNRDLSKNKIFLKRYLKNLPIKRIGIPADVAGLAFYLSSDLSSYITGQNLIIDGGYSIV